MRTCILIINKLHEPEAVVLKRTALQILSRNLTIPHTFLFDTQTSLRDCEGLSGQKSVYSEQWQMRVNYGISIGGDGTLLYMMRKFQNRRSPPVYVFQKGTLGFLCIYESKQMEKTMEALAQNINQGLSPKTFQVSRLHCRAFNKKQSICSYHALNEVTLHKGSRFRPIDFSISLNGHPFTNSRGDGLIVGTQTGSTAYSLSANGPIICQGSKATLLVPLAPQSLSFRPVALPNTIKIGLKLLCAEGSKAEGQICCDGQLSFKVDQNYEVEVESSKYPVQLVLPDEAEGDILFMKKVVSVLRWNCPFGSTL